VLAIYQKILIAALIAVFGGDIVIFYLKKLLVDPKAVFTIDLSGIIERTVLILIIAAGSFYVFLIPVIVMIRALFLVGEGRMKVFSDIINREEPAVQFQKVRIKSDLAVTLLASPTLGILLGIIAKFL
jgi:uncharacterized membrane protein (UPF0182 family)